VVIDEIHRAPGLFEVLRGIIDERRSLGERCGHFLLLGSASLELMRQASETLAGRAAYLDLAPLDIMEIGAAAIDDSALWLRGGFPDSLLAAMVIENLIAAAGEQRVPYFYRSQNGAEIDLLFEFGGTPDIAIQVKRSSAPSPDKGFALACDDLAIRKRFVVYPGIEQFGLRHGAQAISLRDMVQLLRARDPTITASAV